MVTGVVVTPTGTVAFIPFVPVIVIVAVPGPCGVTTKTLGPEPGATVATPALLVLAVNGPAPEPPCSAVTVWA